MLNYRPNIFGDLRTSVSLQDMIGEYRDTAYAAVATFIEYIQDAVHTDQEVLDHMIRLPISAVDRWLEDSPSQRMWTALEKYRPEIAAKWMAAMLLP